MSFFKYAVPFLAILLLVSACVQKELPPVDWEDEIVEFDGVEYVRRQPHLAAVARWEAALSLPKIHGGKDAELGQFPWQVSIHYSWKENPVGAHFCGGVLLDREHVLTAAHCVYKYRNKLNAYSVVAGATTLDKNAKRIPIEDVRIHQDFVIAEGGDDIAILKLKRKAPKSIPPVTLATDDSWFRDRGQDDQTLLTIMGWGTTETSMKSETLLYADDLPFVSNQRCSSTFARGDLVTNRMLCAGKDNGGTDACQYDSGGPLLVMQDQILRQAGIISWGEDCAFPGNFGVYTRVTSYADWISKCWRDTSACRKK